MMMDTDDTTLLIIIFVFLPEHIIRHHVYSIYTQESNAKQVAKKKIKNFCGVWICLNYRYLK